MARLFVCREIVNQIEAGIIAMKENTALFDKRNMKAQYIYIYSLFESTLTETLRYYLTGFPEKIDNNIKISKEQLLTSSLTSVVILDLVNKCIRNYSGESLKNYIVFYLRTLAIDVDLDEERIQKISNVRNIIVHDNLKTSSNLHYVAHRDKDTIELSNLEDDSNYLIKILSEIECAVGKKYSKYTLEKVCRTIWNETFFTSLLNFDDVWRIDDGIIHIKDFENVHKKYRGLCGAEKTLFAIFLQQYSDNLNDDIFKFRDMRSICSLDNTFREKLINIVQLFIAHPYLFNGEQLC